VALPPIAWWSGAPRAVVVMSIAVAVLILFRHRANLRRLRLGTERRMGSRA
jgi:acyl phosphate:glycerol-3-phosphate acyltransferase